MLGAFGAHGLEGKLASGAISQRQLEAFITGADYQLIHAVLLVVMGIQSPAKWKKSACISFIAGMIIFSGCLYIYGLTGSVLAAMITPIGGIAYIAGWVFAALYFWKKV